MKAQGYYYSTIQDIVEWENKLKLKNNLSFTWTDEYKRTHQQKGKVKKLTTSVQCSANNFSDKVWYIGDSEDYRCRNKTKNANGLCYLHQLRDQNISIKYWKDKK
jgi:hypothetical protein